MRAGLALKGMNIPAAIMPMPLMGATAPGSMISTIVPGNCEVLSMLCLLQAHDPGVPIIYAPALAVMDPRSAALKSASIEYSIMGAAATEMTRYYGLPARYYCWARHVGRIDGLKPGAAAGRC